MDELWQRCGDPAAWPCVFIGGKCVRDSRENPGMGRRGAGTELQRIARQDALIKKCLYDLNWE